MVHDALVLGATVAGLTVARRLARRGYDVIVLDPNLEDRSASIGHGVAAVGHASTVAQMATAYGLDPAREHARRNMAAMAEIRAIHPDHRIINLRDRSLPGGDERETRAVAELFRSAGADVDLLLAPDGAALITDAVAVDPAAYAVSLRSAAVAAGAKVVYGVTVTHMARRDGVTRIGFRNNLAWARDPGSTTGVAVIDTLGVSPWGRAARVGPPQWVPVVHCRPPHPVQEVSLGATGPAWMIRPVEGDRALLLGRKVAMSAIDEAEDELARWAVREFGAENERTGRLAIDPSDNGRPIVGASAIPGGFYARGNGRGELMNGTASGYYLSGLLLGTERSPNSLPPLSRLRALGTRALRRG